MAFRHGIYIEESPTPLIQPVQVDSALPFAFGAAPVHRLENPSESVNVPKIMYSFGEGVQYFGYSDNWFDADSWQPMFNLSEMLYSQMQIHRISPLIMVNVWDPEKDAEDASIVQLPVINNVAEIDDGMAMISKVKISDPADPTKIFVRDTDYSLKYDGEKLLVTAIKGGAIDSGGLNTLNIDYKKAVLNIDADDIGGGIDASTNKRTGIELADEAFLLYQKNPAFLLAPGWSDKPEVAALLISKAKALNNNNFRCIALLDLPATSDYSLYNKLPEWKNKNGYADPFAFADWPCVAIGDRVFHASTRLAGMFGEIDAQNGGRPHVSASNKRIQMTKICLEDGTEIPLLDQGQANFLNENGIGTFLNWGGWTPWGNETTAYPSNTDVKDCERSIRRSFCWIQNTVNRTIWQKVDGSMSRPLIDGILLTLTQWFNALTSEGVILGGRVEFIKADNEKATLVSGRLYFRVYISPPGAAKDITFDFQYDPDYLETLYS